MRRHPHGIMPLLFFIARQKIRVPGFYKHPDNFISLIFKKSGRNSRIHPAR